MQRLVGLRPLRLLAAALAGLLLSLSIASPASAAVVRPDSWDGKVRFNGVTYSPPASVTVLPRVLSTTATSVSLACDWDAHATFKSGGVATQAALKDAWRSFLSTLYSTSSDFRVLVYVDDQEFSECGTNGNTEPVVVPLGPNPVVVSYRFANFVWYSGADQPGRFFRYDTWTIRSYSVAADPVTNIVKLADGSVVKVDGTVPVNVANADEIGGGSTGGVVEIEERQFFALIFAVGVLMMLAIAGVISRFSVPWGGRRG